jgi:hypothetical protein
MVDKCRIRHQNNPGTSSSVYLWLYFTHGGSHFENTRWPPYLHHCWGYQTLWTALKHGFRHQDHVSMCSKTDFACIWMYRGSHIKMADTERFIIFPLIFFHGLFGKGLNLQSLKGFIWISNTWDSTGGWKLLILGILKKWKPYTFEGSLRSSKTRDNLILGLSLWGHKIIIAPTIKYYRIWIGLIPIEIIQIDLIWPISAAKLSSK